MENRKYQRKIHKQDAWEHGAQCPAAGQEPQRWSWNLTGDRFPQAHERLDYHHASQNYRSSYTTLRVPVGKVSVD